MNRIGFNNVSQPCRAVSAAVCALRRQTASRGGHIVLRALIRATTPIEDSVRRLSVFMSRCIDVFMTRRYCRKGEGLFDTHRIQFYARGLRHRHHLPHGLGKHARVSGTSRNSPNVTR